MRAGEAGRSVRPKLFSGLPISGGPVAAVPVSGVLLLAGSDDLVGLGPQRMDGEEPVKVGVIPWKSAQEVAGRLLEPVPGLVPWPPTRLIRRTGVRSERRPIA